MQVEGRWEKQNNRPVHPQRGVLQAGYLKHVTKVFLLIPSKKKKKYNLAGCCFFQWW